ncbi:MAG: hypothetical protein ACYC6F_18080, partial [Longimicrobiales bacterium]
LARFFDILASVVVCGPLATALVRGQPVTSSISRKVRIGVKHYNTIATKGAFGFVRSGSMVSGVCNLKVVSSL